MKSTITIEDTNNGENCTVAFHSDPPLEQILLAVENNQARSTAALMTQILLANIHQMHRDELAGGSN